MGDGSMRTPVAHAFGSLLFCSVLVILATQRARPRRPHPRSVMKHIQHVLPVGLVAVAGLSWLTAQPASTTGPATEKRFPPLKVPAGFKATLFACDPLVEYPSAIALGPRPGTLLVAHDYMTGLGTEIVRRDEVRLLEDTDGDGYADKSTVFATGFNSIQGMTYHDGTLYLMHAPYLTAVRDTDGDGRADDEVTLLEGPPFTW